MSTINYPIDQDKSIETWTLTTAQDQINYFGRTYGVGELVPVNYNEILLGLINVSIPYAPLREYVYTTKTSTRTNLNNESNSASQSTTLATAMVQLYEYWKTKILIDFKYPLGVVTAMSSEIIQDNAIVPTEGFHLLVTLKIQWFKIPN